MTVVDLPKRKRAKRAPRGLVPLDDGGASRYFRRVAREIIGDLGGRGDLSRIEKELIQAFAGAATQMRYLNVQVALGDSSAIDLSGYATVASTLLRIGSRLGLRRRPRDAQVLDPLEYAARHDKDDGSGDAAADADEGAS